MLHAWLEFPQRFRESLNGESAQLCYRHQSLSRWIEAVWPFLSIALRKARNADQAVAAVLAAKERVPFVMEESFYRFPEKYKEQLWEFLESDRLRGNPRNLAG